MSDIVPEEMAPPPEESPRERLTRESGVLSWSELARHFARGVVIRVDARLDLIEAAMALVADDESRVGEWLESGAIARASDDDARDWVAREPEFLCVVTSPWVLVQERPVGQEPPAS